MAVTIIANGHLGTLKKQRVSTNSTSVQLSKILNDANIIPPVTNEPGKVFSFWGTTINGFDIGGYTINQLYSIGAITKDGILNIYANYSYAANNIQITFNANGGKFADGTTTKVASVALGSIYAELESTIDLPTLSGKAFKSWTDPSNTVINGYSEFSEAIILTAQWETATNVNITAKDSRGKSVISGLYPKATLWKDLYAQAVSNGYTPDDTTKPFSKILPGYGSYTGQAVKKIDFSVANNPMKIGWLRGSIYDVGNSDVSLYTNRNLLIGTNTNSNFFMGTGNGSFTTAYVAFANGYKWQLQTQRAATNYSYIQHKGLDISKFKSDTDYTISFMMNTNVDFNPGVAFTTGSALGNFINQMDKPKILASGGDQIVKIRVHTYSIPADIGQTLYINGFAGLLATISFWDLKINEGSYSPYSKAPEDVEKKIRDFSSTNIPVDPSTTFSVTGKSSAALSLTHNPIGQDEYWTNRNYFSMNKIFDGFIDGDGSVNTMYGGNYLTDYIPVGTSSYVRIQLTEDPKGYGSNTVLAIYDANKKLMSRPLVGAGGSIPEILPDGTKAFNVALPSGTAYIRASFNDGPTLGKKKIEFSSSYTDWTPAMEDIKPGLWLNDDWLYNPYTQKWLDSSLDRTDFTYSNAVITFKDYFNVQYVIGDISKVRSSVVVTVKSVVAGYGSTTDKHALYNNSYFPNSDSGVTLKVEEYLGYSYIIFYNPSSGYYQKVYQQAGTKYSEFLKLISKPKFDINGKFMKGFYVSNYWANSKLIAGMPINAPIEYAFSGYLDPNTSTFVRVTFDSNGGTFYKGTSYETDSITMEVSPLDTYGIAINYLPDISKRTLGVLFWVMDLVNMEPAYPLTVTNGQTLYPKWTITDKVELYRKPREYYLIDLDSVYNGWDMMDKFSLSDKNNIFVIDPTGTGVSYSEDNAKSNSNGWSKYDRGISSNTIEFEAYYNGYDQYNRLGRWLRGKELVLAMLNETGIPTYWTVDIAEIERTEIKYGEDLLHGKISFNKTSPAFDLEFIGLGTDNTIDNSDDMFRRNAYVYIHSLRVPDADKGIQIIATNGETTIEDAVDVDLPAGSYFEYSTLPFRELWKYGSSWNNLTNNLYNNIIDLVGARPIKVGIGKWDISVSSSNKVPISSLAPHKIQDYAGKTIDSLGGLGPFTGIAIKEKEL